MNINSTPAGDDGFLLTNHTTPIIPSQFEPTLSTLNEVTETVFHNDKYNDPQAQPQSEPSSQHPSPSSSGYFVIPQSSLSPQSSSQTQESPATTAPSVRTEPLATTAESFPQQQTQQPPQQQTQQPPQQQTQQSPQPQQQTFPAQTLPPLPQPRPQPQSQPQIKSPTLPQQPPVPYLEQFQYPTDSPYTQCARCHHYIGNVAIHNSKHDLFDSATAQYRCSVCQLGFETGKGFKKHCGVCHQIDIPITTHHITIQDVINLTNLQRPLLVNNHYGYHGRDDYGSGDGRGFQTKYVNNSTNLANTANNIDNTTKPKKHNPILNFQKKKQPQQPIYSSQTYPSPHDINNSPHMSQMEPSLDMADNNNNPNIEMKKTRKKKEKRIRCTRCNLEHSFFDLDSHEQLHSNFDSRLNPGKFKWRCASCELAWPGDDHKGLLQHFREKSCRSGRGWDGETNSIQPSLLNQHNQHVDPLPPEPPSQRPTRAQPTNGRPPPMERCQRCGVEFYSSSKQHHVQSHTNWDLVDHFGRPPAQYSQFRCEECQCAWSTNTSLMKHFATQCCQTGRAYDPVEDELHTQSCDRCGLGCSASGVPAHLRSHANYDQGKELFPLRCDICQIAWGDERAYIQHFRSKRCAKGQRYSGVYDVASLLAAE